MKTICIKTNNENAIEYLLKMLKNYNLEDVYFSCKKFKSFKNLFIHYKGSNLKFFLFNISEILSFLIFICIFDNIRLRCKHPKIHIISYAKFFEFINHQQI